MKKPKLFSATAIYTTVAVALLIPIHQHSAATPRQIRLQGPTIVIHGGAGVTKGELTPDEEKQCHQALAAALTSGYEVLKKGGHSVDAVAAAVKSMEDSKVFNAGAGAVFNHEGKNELDAAIMDGATHDAGAVAGVTMVKNPIEAAIAVMKKSKHVMRLAMVPTNSPRNRG